jgi:uncharacterized protein
MLLEADPDAVSIQPAPDRRLWRTVVAVSVFWTVVWFLGVLFLWSAQSWLVFMTGESRTFTTPFDASVFVESSFPNADGLRLETVLLTHEPSGNGYWILFCPPAGASIRVGRRQGHLKQLWSLGYNVFAFDYRGFGDNAGTPTEAGLYADATAAYRYLVHEQGIPASRVILAGRSLGASIAVDLATRVEAGGVLLFSPIDSVPSVATRLYPWAPVRRLARYQFDSRSKAKTIDVPVILVYGRADHFMPLSNARALFLRFRGRKEMLETNGNHHHSGFMDLPRLQQALSEFWPTAQDSSAR